MAWCVQLIIGKRQQHVFVMLLLAAGVKQHNILHHVCKQPANVLSVSGWSKSTVGMAMAGSVQACSQQGYTKDVTWIWQECVTRKGNLIGFYWQKTV